MQIKSHESPRAQGRNKKGKGGSARKRQIDKRNRQLRNQLKKDRSLGAVFLWDRSAPSMPCARLAATGYA